MTQNAKEYPLTPFIVSYINKYQFSPVVALNNNKKAWWKLLKLFSQLIRNPVLTEENKNTPKIDIMKYIRNMSKETFIKAGKENIAVSISFFNSGNYLTNLNNLETLRTLKILVIWGADYKNPTDEPEKDITISKIDVKTTKKSNWLDLFLK